MTARVGERGGGRGGRGWRIGLAIGAAVGLGVGYLGRRMDRVAHRGLVDWERAEQIAASRLRGSAGALSPAELRAVEPRYAETMARVVPLLERTLGAPLPGVVERHEVVDRAAWASANLVTFRSLIDRLEVHLIERRDPDTGFAAGLAATANRFLTTQQIAFLLTYLGNRVLGQYDIGLLSAETKPGRLLYVEENIRATAQALGVPLDDFRTWICLHETTHAFELEAHPWLRPHLADLLERQIAGLLEEAKTVRRQGLGELVRRFRQPGDDALLAGFLSPEQRLLLRETQRTMSLLEGFSDWVMDEVGSELVSDVALLRERFEARRAQRRKGLERLVARLTGLDMKLEQYRRGERFVAGVAAVGGRDAVAKLWQDARSLPTEEEMADPASWVRRVAPESVGGAATADTVAPQRPG